MLERKIQEDQGVIPGVDFVTAAVTLAVTQQCVRATANPTTGAYAITLPNVSQARGKIFAIMALDADATNTITVQDADESEQWTNIVLVGASHGCVVYSDGHRWWVLAQDTTPTTGTPTTT